MTTQATQTTHVVEQPIHEKIVCQLLDINPDFHFDRNAKEVTAKWIHKGYPVEISADMVTDDGIDYVVLNRRLRIYVDTDGCDDRQFDNVESEIERRHSSFIELFANSMNKCII